MGIISDHKDFLRPVLLLVIVLLILAFVLSTGGITNTANFFKFLPGYSTNNTTLPSSSVTATPTPTTGLQGHKPELTIDTSKDYYALINTSLGRFRVDLTERGTPETVNSFVYLANQGFYNNMKVHRVEEGILIQMGDPTGTGNGGPNYQFDDELNAKDVGLDAIKVSEADFLKPLYDADTLTTNSDLTVQAFYEKLGYHYNEKYRSTRFAPGVVGMANSGPNTNGSQFFILLSSVNFNTRRALDGKYTTFGMVVDGQEVVDRIGASKSNAGRVGVSNVEIFKQ